MEPWSNNELNLLKRQVRLERRMDSLQRSIERLWKHLQSEECMKKDYTRDEIKP